jgi:cytochrome c
MSAHRSSPLRAITGPRLARRLRSVTRSGRRAAIALGVAVLAPAVVVAGCAAPERGPAPPEQMDGGNPQRGSELIASYGCGSCHEVPGVDSADGLVGPPLAGMGRRAYVAGMLPNTASNLEHWIQDPQEVVPGNAMPDLGVTSRDARDITAYLYKLR